MSSTDKHRAHDVPRKDVPPEQWRDWRWQLKHSVTSLGQLKELTPLGDAELVPLEMVAAVYPVRITPYYLSLIDWADPADPIRLQALPDPREMLAYPNLKPDPLQEEAHSPLPWVVHRYPDRVLLIVNNFCPVLCRFCTRKRLMRGQHIEISNDEIDAALEYVARQDGVHDVLVSGGNPLVLPTAKLRRILRGLARIEHVHVVRLATREPVTLPQRLFDQQLLDLLRTYADKLWVSTHFNHAREITPESMQAVRNLVQLGIPVVNQTVLLKGVNDRADSLETLFRELVRIKVKPYYLLHADPTEGTGHFRTSVLRGAEIVESLRWRLSGLALPGYVVDSPELSKIPIVPQYVESVERSYVRLRDLHGNRVDYPNGSDD